LRIRGFCPTTSSDVYPVSSVNFGMTYSMVPAMSVMTTQAGLCSTARDRDRSRSSFLRRSVMSQPQTVAPTIAPSGSEIGPNWYSAVIGSGW
jgi:hypothetical protein